MSKKHEKRTRSQILARRTSFRKGVTIFVPDGVKIVNGRVIHANPNVSGEKERERGARFYMHHYFPFDGPIQTDPLRLRSAPVMQITCKRWFYEIPF